MEGATAELISGPTFVSLQAQSPQLTSELSQASSKSSPLATIAGYPANAFPDGLAPARGPLVNDDAGDTIIGITCMLLVLCIAAVVARILARRISKLRLEADDYLALIGLCLIIGLSTEQILLATYGRSMKRAPSLGKLKSIEQLRFASQLTYLFVTTTAKLCVLMLYRRIFSLRVRWFRIAWWINTMVAILNGLLLLIFGLTLCAPHPPSYAWHHLGSCKEDPTSIAPMGFVNAATDFSILLLPIRMCWSLQLSRKRKLGLFIVLGLGLIAVAVSVARAVAIATGGISRDSAGALNFVIWSTTEPAVALICACLPITRSLLATSISKISYYNRNGWLCFERSRSTDTESTRNLSPSASNHQLKVFGSAPTSTLLSQDASHKEYFFGSGNTHDGNGKPRSTHPHAETRDSMYSETYPLADMYRQVETPERETPLKVDKGLPSSECGFDNKS